MTIEASGGGGGGGIIANLSDKIGAPEAAIRLLLTLLAGYPIALIYRFLIQPQSSKPVHHIFFSLCGFGLCFFNYGLNTYHSLVCIWITYLLVRLLRNSPTQLVGVNFIFHMIYLLTGYYFTESNEYDILWTTPHCVLTLRLIGFAFDVADGVKPREKLSKDQLECNLEKVPSLLELMAYAYFPGSFLIGPQFPYRRYQRFINGEFMQYKGYVRTGLIRLCLGLVYLLIRQVGAMMLPDNYFLTDAYRNQAYLWRLIYLGLWGKFSLYKYISCWLLAEGALMCLGFTYNGKQADGNDDWYGCSNVKLYLLETGNTMEHYVKSFNVNTNQWVASYVYKRLKFLNNREISYGAALGFLAVWHGFHSGYYMSFFIEYMIVTTEKQVEDLYKKDIVPNYGGLVNSMPFKLLKFIALKSYNLIYMGWCLTPFIFLSFDRWLEVFKAVNYFGFIYVAMWFIFFKVYKKIKSAQRRKANERVPSRATDLSPTMNESQSKDSGSKATDLSPNMQDNKKDN
ncbi:lysophospholipid acyltransferase 5 [Musca domestica]|uniref:Lysophospholipid acyltransferase 5 n=1 Tax=Musca domestica TaxID=7370 RepID=T1PGH2_MUSDO|nr:lysophospholipid acyltransferase 5 [Musca domestica]XP_011291312.1 lysophospholipid acyltransferase 5 [Musca domestica]XP_058980212.1 lysophospholipid acyltransferase 5 [Musca domestica]XP_058980213.1 lysophospholipid acyltransferase 5 [Musca domestica]